MSVDALVINLTRFGDLLQSQAVIDDLHQAGHRVGLVCQDNFATAIPLLRNVAQSWALPGAKLLARLDTNWQAGLAEFSGFIAQIREEGNPKAILNLTPTLPARLLTRSLCKPQTRALGFDLDAFGYSLNHGVWASYFSAAASRRANSPFNLSDLLRMMAQPLSGARKGTYRLAEPAESEWASRFLAAHTESFTSAPAGYIAFQLGASENKRRWPVENFRELGQIIWKKMRLAPVLLGSRAESQLGIEYANGAAHPFINAIGKTDIPQLAALLKQMRLLATNDTGTMHLAAGLQTPILAFFLATAQPWDTGPLLPGSLCLEPALACHPCAFNQACQINNKCGTQISPETAAGLAFAQLGCQDIGINNPESEARIWQTTQDEHGLTTLTPFAAQLSDSSSWLLWQRRFWRQLLDCLDEPERAETASGEIYTGLPPFASSQEVASQSRQAAAILDNIAGCASAATKSPRLGEIFLRNCERLQSYLDTCAQLDSLAVFWREMRSNQAADLPLFGAQAKMIAARLRALAKALA